MKVQIAYGERGLEVELPSDRTTVIVPTHSPPRRGRAGGGPHRAPSAGRRAAAPGCRAAWTAGRDQRLRRHTRAAAPTRDPGDPRRARRSRRPRGRRHPRRDRDSPGQHRRRVARDARGRRARLGPGRQPRRPRRGVARLARPLWRRRPRVAQPPSGSTPTSASPPASSSRTSSPASPAGRRWSLPAWPRSRRSSRCTTRSASVIRTRAGASSTGTRCTTTFERSRPRPARASPSTSSSMREQQLVRAYGGELDAAHRAACSDAMKTAMRRVPGALRRRGDLELGLPARSEPLPVRQGHVGRVAGGEARWDDRLRRRVPRRLPGSRGLSRPARGRRLRGRPSSQEIAARRETVVDQWQIQIQAAIQARARVVMHTSYLSDDELASAHLEQTNDVSATVGEALAAAGDGATGLRPPGGTADDSLRRVTRRVLAAPGQVPRVRDGSRGRALDREGAELAGWSCRRAAARRRRRGNARRPRRANRTHPRHRAARARRSTPTGGSTASSP